MSSLTEMDIRQNSDSTNYIYFSETDDSLQHACQSMCGQEGIWECQSDFPSYHPTSEIWLHEEASLVKSEITLLKQQFLQRHSMFYEDCNQHYESNCFPLCYASFEFLKQILRASKRTQKLEDMAFSEIDNEKGNQPCNQSHPMRKTIVFHEGLNHKEKDEKGEQLESGLHSNPPFYEKEDGYPSNVQEDGHTNFLYENYNQHVENSVSDVIIEDFSSLIYDEYEDGYLDHAPREPTVCNKKMDHQE